MFNLHLQFTGKNIEVYADKKHFLCLDLPTGTGNVTVRYTEEPVFIIMDSISIGGLLFLVIFWKRQNIGMMG